MSATEATLPPTPYVCPQCRRPREAFLDPISGPMLKCPEHGLAFVDAHELAASDNDPLLGASIVGRFTVLGRLGRGSMGAVYRARQEAVGRDVALKIVRPDRAYDPETKARFEREARAISLLTSPHTITAFDFGEAEDGSWFLAMEMLEGETVGDRLRREGRIDWVDAVRFAQHALRSLAEAHEKGIVHRDLKPDNLFLTVLPESRQRKREICKVLDFGIAKWQVPEDAKIDQLETQAGTVFGTPRYMSPEQAQGSPLDARSDLYSLGVLLYQMLSGRAPFTDDDAVVVMARHIKDEPTPLSEISPEGAIPPSVEAVVRRALAKNPDERPQTAEQMAVELEQAFELARATASGVQPSHSVSESAPPVPLPPASRIGVRAVGILLALVVLALGFGAWSALREKPSRSTPGGNRPVVAKARRSLVELEQTLVHGHRAESKENSKVAAPVESSRTQGSQRVRKRSFKSSADQLPKKGNERYGRFE